MDPFLLGSLSIILLAITFIVVKIVSLARDERKSKMLADALKADAREERREAARNQAPVVVGGRRRNVPVRRRVNQADQDDSPMDLAGMDSEEEMEEDPLDNLDLPDGKIGKKKMAKLQAKAEKRNMRESELQEREEKKKRDAEKEAKQKAEEEKLKLEEEKEEQIRQKEKEEKEEREREAYLKMKQAFTVEEEGYDEEATLDSHNLLQEFIAYIKNVKVAHVDELAAHFKLRSPDVVARIESLVAERTLTGVIDDRGKFIYITEAELAGVARFINQRGRVSVAELVEYSNQLIKLDPDCSSSSKNIVESVAETMATTVGS